MTPPVDLPQAFCSCARRRLTIAGAGHCAATGFRGGRDDRRAGAAGGGGVAARRGRRWRRSRHGRNPLPWAHWPPRSDPQGWAGGRLGAPLRERSGRLWEAPFSSEDLVRAPGKERGQNDRDGALPRGYGRSRASVAGHVGHPAVGRSRPAPDEPDTFVGPRRVSGRTRP